MAKKLALVYGIFCYLLFNLVFLYFIAFIGNFLVPQSIDASTETPLGQALLINLVLIILFGLQHSVMARPQFKTWWTRIIPQAIERSTYVLFSCLFLILLFGHWQPIPTLIWDVENSVLRSILWGIFGFGWLFANFSSFLTNHYDLVGLRQVYLYAQGQPYTHPHFVIKSVYKYVRHPIMLGTVIGLWVTPTMSVGHLLLASGFTLYILIGVSFEERDLKKLYGKSYEEYQRKTSMLIPLPRYHV